MRVTKFKVKNIKAKGRRVRKHSRRLNHSKEEWAVIVARINAEDKVRREKEQQFQNIIKQSKINLEKVNSEIK